MCSARHLSRKLTCRSRIKIIKARPNCRVHNLKCSNEGINNVLRLNQAICNVALLFCEVKLRKLMCIQQFLILYKTNKEAFKYLSVKLQETPFD